MGDLDVTKEGNVGVEGGKMSVAITNLEDLKGYFTTWNTQLLDLKDLVIADWFGGAADEFQSSYDKMTDTMLRMIDAAGVLRDIANATVEGYGYGDETITDDVHTIMSGFGV